MAEIDIDVLEWVTAYLYETGHPEDAAQVRLAIAVLKDRERLLAELRKCEAWLGDVDGLLEDRDRLRADWGDAMRQAVILCNRNRPTMAGAILQAALDRWLAAALEGRDG